MYPGTIRKIVGLSAVGLGLALASCASLPGMFKEGDGKVVTTDKGTCSFLAPESKLHPLSACESATHYFFRAGDDQFAYAKADFQRQLKDRVLQFVRTTNYPWQALSSATVEIWLEGKVFDPKDAQLKVVVLSAAGNFAFPLSVDQNAWEIVPKEVVRLGQDRYPSLAAKRAGVLAVLAKQGVSEERLKDFLAASGVLEARTLPGRRAVLAVDGAAPLITLETEPFAEPMVAKQLASHKWSKVTISDVRYVRAGEAEGYKARVFSFGW